MAVVVNVLIPLKLIAGLINRLTDGLVDNVHEQISDPSRQDICRFELLESQQIGPKLLRKPIAIGT